MIATFARVVINRETLKTLRKLRIYMHTLHKYTLEVVKTPSDHANTPNIGQINLDQAAIKLDHSIQWLKQGDQ